MCYKSLVFLVLKLWSTGTLLKDDTMKTIEKLAFGMALRGMRWFAQKEVSLDLNLFSFLIYTNQKSGKVEERALSSLCDLRTHKCPKLRTVPDGLRYISTLMEMTIGLMPRKYIQGVKEGGKDLYKFQHVPSLVFLNMQEYISCFTSFEALFHFYF